MQYSINIAVVIITKMMMVNRTEVPAIIGAEKSFELVGSIGLEDVESGKKNTPRVGLLEYTKFGKKI